MREEFMNISIHDNEQLENVLHGKILSREKLSHWPLSYVEKVVLEDGSQLIYKSQRSDSSVEFEFFSRISKNQSGKPTCASEERAGADESFLIRPVYFEKYQQSDIMLFPYSLCPPLGKPDENKLERIVSDISQMIQCFDLPFYFDFSTVDKLLELVEEVQPVFEGTNRQQDLNLLKKWICEKTVVYYKSQNIGKVHGDLTGSNILMENGKIRYILDWQRPIKAPLDLETALAFRLAGYDAVKRYGDMGILAVVNLFLWYGYAYLRLLPIDGVIQQAHELLSEIISLIK